MILAINLQQSTQPSNTKCEKPGSPAAPFSEERATGEAF